MHTDREGFFLVGEVGRGEFKGLRSLYSYIEHPGDFGSRPPVKIKLTLALVLSHAAHQNPKGEVDGLGASLGSRPLSPRAATRWERSGTQAIWVRAGAKKLCLFPFLSWISYFSFLARPGAQTGRNADHESCWRAKRNRCGIHTRKAERGQQGMDHGIICAIISAGWGRSYRRLIKLIQIEWNCLIRRYDN